MLCALPRANVWHNKTMASIFVTLEREAGHGTLGALICFSHHNLRDRYQVLSVELLETVCVDDLPVLMKKYSNFIFCYSATRTGMRNKCC